jgi:hypothetical protein
MSRATASNSCRKNIGLSKLPPDSIRYRKVAEKRGYFFFEYVEMKNADIENK